MAADSKVCDTSNATTTAGDAAVKASSTRRPVMITGASSGIGLELARHYAVQGSPLVLIARNQQRLLDTAKQLSQLNPVYASNPEFMTTLSLNVADASAVSEKLAECILDHGVPGLLINAAGVVNVGRFLEMSPDYFDDNLRIDFEGTVHTCRAIAPAMVTAGTGHIVNIASVAGYLGIYGYTGYSAAKFAVMGFSEALRFEMKPLGVKVSVVCPPDTKTPGLAAERAARPTETEVIAGGIAAMDAAEVARRIVRGINSQRFYIIIGASSKLYFRLKGLLPEVFFTIVDGQVRKARKAPSTSATSHSQTSALHDISSPSACLPEHIALSEGEQTLHPTVPAVGLR